MPDDGAVLDRPIAIIALPARKVFVIEKRGIDQGLGNPFIRLRRRGRQRMQAGENEGGGENYSHGHTMGGNQILGND